MSNIFQRRQAEIDQLAADSHNMHNTSSGGNHVLLEDGSYPGYLCQYVELGSHADEYEGKVTGVFPNIAWGVAIFPDEVDEPDNYIILDNGSFRFGMPVKTGEKSAAVRMFRGLNVTNDPSLTHIAQFLGEPRLFKVVKKKNKQGKEYNNIDWAGTTLAVEGRGKNARQIELNMVKETDARMFFWDNPTAEDWDNLYIEPKSGERDDGTKYEVTNFIQNMIVSAKNFEGSALQEMLEGSDFDWDAFNKAKAEENKPRSRPAAEVPVEDLAVPEDEDSDEAEEAEPAPKPRPKPAPRPAPRRPATRPTPPKRGAEPEGDDAPWEDED